MANFNRVKSKVMDILNVASSYGTFDTSNPRFTQGLIDDTIRQSDAKVVHIILSSNSPLRMQYLTPVTVSQNAPLPASVGPYGPVMITRSDNATVQGVKTSRTNIELFQQSSSTYPNAEGYYSFDDGLFKFTGTSAQIYCGRVPDNSSQLQAPDQFEDAIVYLTVAALYAKLEDAMQAAQFYAELANKLLSTI